MELKPENEEKELKYPSEENVDKEKLKKPLKKWQKVGIISIALVIICAIFWNWLMFHRTSNEAFVEMIESEKFGD